MREIPLTQGKTALVDDGDYEWLSQWNWHAEVRRRRDGSIRAWYARRRGRRGETKSVWMHNALLVHHGLLTLTPPGRVQGHGQEVDHIDHDGLNNQMENLRAVTRSQNNQNSRKRPGAASPYKGVSRERNRWAARLSKKRVGVFDTQHEAAFAYDAAARSIFGEHAYLNFPKARG